jgi:crotonobetainyl-CoA:carnitine CoA-transferase CaiB-like acyl-CoA transferase
MSAEHPASAVENPRPLAGLKVVDMASFLAGPLASMFLADFGAEVIKIERPGTGDESRFWGRNKNGIGLYYKVINRNKKSVTVDLHTSFGVEVVKRLVRDADLIIENFRPGTLERWGLGFDVLSAINPRISMLRISGYGQTGPYSSRPGFGTLAEAFSGFAHINGEAGQRPLLPAFGLADSTTGLMGAFLAAVAVLNQKMHGGPGQVIDLALYEPLLTLLGPQVVDYDQLGVVQQRSGSRLPFTAPRNTYQTRDGKWISMAGSAQSTFERICDALERPDLFRDPRFADNRKRLQNNDDLDVELQKAIRRFDLADLLTRFEEIGATAAPVNDVAQVLADPHVQARENIKALEDSELGVLRMQNVVGRMSRTPGRIEHAGPPLGMNNVEVLVGRLGFTVEELTAAGIETGGAAACEPAAVIA